jgi:hypothetical protein
MERYNNEKYVILGEPVLHLPRANATLQIDQNIDTLQALQKVTISGNSSLTGAKIRLQVVEGEVSRLLLHRGKYSTDSMYMHTPGAPIHSEELNIEGGRFATEFITPRKLNFGDTSAQVRLWAWQPGSLQTGHALLKNITVSGTSPDAALLHDTTPPEIQIFPCVRAGSAAPFSEGETVRLRAPACLEVVVFDSTGLDYREEADEGISFSLENAQDPWHPWPFLEQTGKRAVARMDFGSGYSEGTYAFKVNAQDILGNFAERGLTVELTAALENGLSGVFNRPNPVRKNLTTFYFKDLTGEASASSATIQIFDQNGRLVRVLRNAVSGVTTWDTRDFHGRLLANGLYHYVVQLKADGKTFSQKQKLVISR